ncbi:SPASM domain-containing protein [bacterium]|nr:SPASM domain-containing protein [bacterium]
MPVASRYNLLLPLHGEQQTLVFNTLRGSAVVVQPQDADRLGVYARPGSGSQPVWRSYGSHSPEVDQAAPTDSPGCWDTLLQLGILVETADAEERTLAAFLDDYWHPRTLKLTMAYTAACQMACGYCFQSGRNLKARHSPALFQGTLDFIEQQVKCHPELEGIHLGLFGGEPLTDVAMATSYIDQLQILSQKHNLSLDISLTTNGLNLHPDLILDWLPKGLKYVRVTLDGPAKIHDQRRPTHGNQPTFHRILSNLRRISNIAGFGLGVSINLDQGNEGAIGDLLDILVEAGLRTQIEILLEATLPTYKLGTLEDHRSQGLRMSTALDQVMLRGFRTPLYPGLCTPCNFVQSNNFVIDWSGNLFRCTFTMLDPQAVVGSVGEGARGVNQALLQSVRQAVGHCRAMQCAYLPLCGGGCRYEADLRTGNWSGHNCPLEYWDEVLPRSIPYTLGI